MKVALGEITTQEKEFSITDSVWFPENEVQLDNVFESTFILRKQDEKSIFIGGKLDCSIILQCDLCSEHFSLRLTKKFEYRVKVEADKSLQYAEVEVTQEDSNTIYLHEPVLDLGEILREQLFLNIPERRVCKPECRGLCMHCG